MRKGFVVFVNRGFKMIDSMFKVRDLKFNLLLISLKLFNFPTYTLFRIPF